MNITPLQELIYRLKETNVTLIIGAGISNEVANIPLGVELASSFAKDMGFKDTKILGSKINELKIRYPYFQKDDFKTIAFALNLLDNAKLKEVSLKYLTMKKLKHPLYSSISSLIEKNVINTVINFNFDELLEYNLSIYTILDSEDYKQNDNAKPLHIKAHGTVSRPDHLRFLRPDWYRLEPKIEKILKQRLQDTETIIVAGFRLNFEPFVKLILNNTKQNFNIYIIDRKKYSVHPHLKKHIIDWIIVDEKGSTPIFQYLDKNILIKPEKNQI